MRKLLPVFLVILCSILAFQAHAQINHALTATASHSSGGAGGYAPSNYNDGIIPIPTGTPWGWTTDGGWIEYTWTNPVLINSIAFYKAARVMSTAEIQYWNGSSYVTFYNYNSAAAPYDSISFPTIYTTNLRFNNIGGSNNPSFREITASYNILAPNNVGVLSVDSPIFYCAGQHDIYTSIINTGGNQIDSVEVHWEFNGVPQPMVHLKQLIDTSGGSFQNIVQINLGSVTFGAGKDTLKIYTSLPNGVPDTVNGDDTLLVILKSAAEPTFASFSPSTLTSVDVNIEGGIGSFEYEYGPAGFVIGNGTSGVSSTSNFSLTGLSNSTSYDFYVRSDCGNGDVSAYVGPFSFCTPYTAPFFNDFEAEDLDLPPTCWNRYVTHSAAWVEVENLTGTSAPYGGSQALYIYGSSGVPGTDTVMAISPMLEDLNIGDKRIRFFANSDDPTSQLIVGTLSDPNSKVLNPLDTIYFPLPDTYKKAVVYFNSANGYNGTDKYIYLMHSLGGSSDYIRIDNFNYELIPTCIEPEDLRVDSIAATTVNVSWTEGNTASEWIVEYGAPGFTLGTGTIDTAHSHPFKLTGLSPYTEYDIYIRTICGVNDSSSWTGPVYFKTLCSPNTAPYYNDFESEALDEAPLCWEYRSTYTSSWVEVEDLTGTAAPYSGGKALYLYSSSANPTSDTVMAISPTFSDLDSNDKQLRFYANSSDPVSQLIIGTMSSQISNVFNVIDTITFPVANTYQEVIIELNSANGYNGTDQYVFLKHSLGGTLDYIRIDEFNYEVIPSCKKVDDLSLLYATDNSADLTWTENNLATSWEIEYGPSGFTLGTGSSVIAGSNPYTLTGLDSATTYDFYVRAICGRGDSSIWVGPSTFNTAYILPFVQDFENFGANTSGIDHIEGWNNTAASAPEWETGTNTVTTSTGPVIDHTIGAGGTFAYLETNGGSQGDFDSLISPPIFIDSNISSFWLEFWYHMYGSTMGDLEVFIESRGVVTPITTIVGEQQTGETDAWRQYKVPISGFSGNSIRVIFKGIRGNGTTGDLSVDDISLKEILPNNAGIASIVNPSGGICPGTTIPVVKVENFGGNTINAVEVVRIINGVADTVSYNNPILMGQSANVALNPYVFTVGLNYDIQVYTQLPNGVSDTLNNNDTITIKGMRTGMAGNYTIDSSQAISATNYHSFSEVANDLNAYGVCGPVNFDIAADIYYQQVTLNEIFGTSTTNSITFDGNDSSMVVLSHDASIDRPTLLLNGSDHVTFKNMTIEATGTTGTAVHLMNQADSNNFNNNILRVSTSSTSSSVNVILMTSNTTSTTAEGNNSNNTTFSNNVILGGYYQVRIEGDDPNYSLGLEFINNDFQEGYYYGFYADNLDHFRFIGNSMNSTRENTNGDGLYLFDIMNFEIEGNQIHVEDYGLYIADANSDFVPSQRAKIVNNMIISDGDYGIYLVDALDVDIFHNSVAVHGTANPALSIISSLTNGIDIRNNILYSENTEALHYDLSFLTLIALNNNIYYKENGSDLVEFDGVTYVDLTGFQSAYPSLNAFSLEGDPRFAAYDNLHLIGNFANNKGDNSVGVSVDIDRDSRPIGNDAIVDIGADEFETITCISPTNFTAFNVSLRNTDITWSSTSSEMEVEFGLAGFLQGNGNKVISNNDTLTLTGLNSNTLYEVYLRSICSPGDTSQWVGPFTFKTSYGLPFFEDFENFGISTTITTDGWSNDSPSALDWESDNNTTSGSTGPDIDHTIGAGGIFLFVEASNGATGDSSDLVSPVITIDSTINVFKLEFWYHKYGQSMGDLEVYIDTNGVFNLITVIPGQTHTSGTEAWTSYSSYITGYEGKDIQLVFRGIRGNNFYSDMAIDDVLLTEAAPFDAALTALLNPVEDIDYCYTASESIELDLTNKGLNSLDFSLDSAFITVDISGAITTSLADTIYDNSIHGMPLATDSNIILNVGTVDMTTAGTYYFEINLFLNKDSILLNNTIMDTIVVMSPSGGLISGIDTICSADTVNLTTSNTVGEINWQVLVGSNFVDVAGATERDYRVGIDSTTSFRVMACNSAVSDTFTVYVMDLQAPIVKGDTVIVTCGDPGTAVLTASSTNTGVGFKWYDSPTSTTPISTNDSLFYTVSTASGTASQSIDTFYVSSSTGGGLANVGAPNNGQATGYTLEAGLYFDVLAPSITIKGVYVYPLGTGPGTIEIGVKETSSGNIIHTTTVNVVGSTPGIRTYVPLGFTIPQGIDYQILWLNKSGGVSGLVRDASSAITGGGFPFTIPGVVSITKGQCCSSNAISTSYYYFYDWEVSSGCESPRALVIGQVDCLVGIDDLESNFANISIHPNPSKGIFHIVGNQVKEGVEISIFTSNGKIVYQSADEFINNFDERIDISGLANGMYFVKLQSGKSMEMKKIVIQ